MRALHNTHIVIANEVKPSYNMPIMNEIATSRCSSQQPDSPLCKAFIICLLNICFSETIFFGRTAFKRFIKRVVAQIFPTETSLKHEFLRYSPLLCVYQRTINLLCANLVPGHLVWQGLPRCQTRHQ